MRKHGVVHASRVKIVGRPKGSSRVMSSPFSLLATKTRVSFLPCTCFCASTVPFTLILSFSAALCPTGIIAPLTRIRPSLIHSSATRLVAVEVVSGRGAVACAGHEAHLEHSPALATSFDTRSAPVGAS
jgi:hypothetical protein